jgi:hypothetical protein
MASFHYLPPIYFFALYHTINTYVYIPLSTASCRGSSWYIHLHYFSKQ